VLGRGAAAQERRGRCP